MLININHINISVTLDFHRSKRRTSIEGLEEEIPLIENENLDCSDIGKNAISTLPQHKVSRLMFM